MNILNLIKDLGNEATAAAEQYQHPDGPKTGLVNATSALLVDFGVPADKAGDSATVVADAVEEIAGGQGGPNDITNDIEKELDKHGVHLPPYVGLILASILLNIFSGLQARLKVQQESGKKV